MGPERTGPRLLLLGGLLVVALATSLAIGASNIPIGDVIKGLSGQGDPETRTIVLQLRLPRSLLAILVGAGLGMAGAVFQAVLRNPLAEPYVLGISGGAAVGAVVAMVSGLAASLAWSLPLAAFVGGLAAMFAVLRIALAVGAGMAARVLILAGVVVGAFLNAIILLLLALADAESFRSAIFWMMGSLSGASWDGVSLLALYALPSMGVLLLLARPLNLLNLGEESAQHLGVPVEAVKRTAYLVTSLLVAATVALAGVIGFVGLVVPHALRLAWSSDQRLVLPGSALAGAAFLLVTDTVARTVIAPVQLPTGVITALVGVPMFVVVLVRSRG